jgi:hypothetical protein
MAKSIKSAAKPAGNIGYKQCGISAKPESSCIFTKSPKLHFGVKTKI